MLKFLLASLYVCTLTKASASNLQDRALKLHLSPPPLELPPTAYNSSYGPVVRKTQFTKRKPYARKRPVPLALYELGRTESQMQAAGSNSIPPRSGTIQEEGFRARRSTCRRLTFEMVEPNPTGLIRGPLPRARASPPAPNSSASIRSDTVLFSDQPILTAPAPNQSQPVASTVAPPPSDVLPPLLIPFDLPERVGLPLSSDDEHDDDDQPYFE